jgi:hypothetical protein
MTWDGGHSDPTADRVVSALARDGANELLRRELRRHLTYEEALVLAAGAAGIPLVLVASRLGKSERTIQRMVHSSGRRLRFEMTEFFTVRHGPLKDIMADAPTGVLDQIVRADGALMALVDEYLARRAGSCRACDAPVEWTARGRPREYCTNRCRQRAYRARAREQESGPEADG